MSNDTITTIDASMTVNRIIAAFPGTVAVFDAWGVDSCCGGHLPLATVAGKHGFDLEKLLRQLNDR